MTASSYPPNVYGNYIPWEIPIQLCLGDLLVEGDCALDVGANIGGLSIAMSRLVGPHGAVHAFEANPFTVARLQADLAANGAKNVTVVPKAAWSRSGETISFYCDDSYYAVASSFRRGADSWKEVTVPTIALDDYCRDNKLAPKAIKLDVEGAEFQVLRGAQWVLDRYAPSLVVEYYPAATADTDPIELLKSRGYALYDTNLYRQVDRDFYLTHFAKPLLVNVLAISPLAVARRRYERAALITSGTTHVKSGTATSGPLPLRQPGRHVLSVDLDGPAEAMAALHVVDESGNRLAYVQTQVEHLRTHTCSNLIFQTDRPLDVTCTISSPEGAAVSLREVTVNRVEFGRAA